MTRQMWKHLLYRRKSGLTQPIKARELIPLPLLHGLYPEVYFNERLLLERRRAERSSKPLVVMIINTEPTFRVDQSGKLNYSLCEGVNGSVRGTDICGVLKEGRQVAVIFTEIAPESIDEAKRIIAKKTKERLATIVSNELMNQITICFRTYPDSGTSKDFFDMSFYPELSKRSGRKVVVDLLKRTMDVVGSVVGLLVFLPFFTLLPMAIKLTSKGPAIFRQERIGCNGRKFMLYKFRSMYIDNDDVIHREYVKQLIKGRVDDGQKKIIYKIQRDPRVTRIGALIRKYSVDELPQLLNILKGDMSLVGPRPPIRYEVEHYCGWQRNRLMGKRPGLSGLWQVSGRSTASFDDMVRLDLRYLKGWRVTLDVKILMRTPLAVLKCKGAY